MNNFETYLINKNIDAQKFKNQENDFYCKWENDFEFINEQSFTQQKLFLINNIRKKYKLDKPIVENIAIKKAENIIIGSENNIVSVQLPLSKPSFKPKFK